MDFCPWAGTGVTTRNYQASFVLSRSLALWAKCPVSSLPLNVPLPHDQLGSLTGLPRDDDAVVC